MEERIIKAKLSTYSQKPSNFSSKSISSIKKLLSSSLSVKLSNAHSSETPNSFLTFIAIFSNEDIFSTSKFHFLLSKVYISSAKFNISIYFAIFIVIIFVLEFFY